MLCYALAEALSSIRLLDFVEEEVGTFHAGFRHLPPILVEHVIQESSWGRLQAVICEVEVEDAVSWHTLNEKALHELECIERLA